MNHKIIFEVMPYSRTSSETYAQKFTQKLAEAINELKEVTLVNIPEIIEENHNGEPYYRNIDPRKFGKELREICKKEIMINTVVVHNPRDKFIQWLDESINSYEIRNFVFVGAKIPSIKYPGPSVPEANLIAKQKNVNYGNIFIPDRPGESDRLLEKTKAGCKFFTSQVLFEGNSAIRTIRSYAEKCKANGIKPVKFYLSFAPVSSEDDITFIKWLGAEMSKSTEQRLKNADNIGEESITLLLDLIKKILQSNMKSGVEIGFNVEYIMLHNLNLAEELVKKASTLLN